MTRTATIERQTAETSIALTINLDGSGTADLNTGIGFFDHMLELFTRHAAVDLSVKAEGDLEVDQHHTVEDTGICLGKAVYQALGDKAGVQRFGHFLLPMEEALASVAFDLSGRYALHWDAQFSSPKIGDFDSELVQDFWQSFAANALCNMHVHVPYGRNNHHISEAIFKSAARALRMAIARVPGSMEIPSTKGTLTD